MPDVAGEGGDTTTDKKASNLPALIPNDTGQSYPRLPIDVKLLPDAGPRLVAKFLPNAGLISDTILLASVACQQWSF
ncbi:hypothetical protein MA16_Dca021627 [Dendrobium catenatum]|uniref:Uncharacterized protein n=1 Tax=Dendrobium catenatum TaxID=906689 RepID=A0A2I0WEY2_9ASPA|nr:hypothetical protein MA16_Dca021627 [Dendrobium catenatum]